MPYGWTVVACIVAFVAGMYVAVIADDRVMRQRVSTGIIFIDTVPYSMRPFNREAPPS